MSMDNVIGHDNVKRLLRSAADADSVSHAYIFEGASGVGRLTAAKAFAEEAVGCPAGFSADNHPDIAVARNSRFGDTKKKTPGLSIAAVRALKKDVYTRPYMGRRKMYIIPDADKMEAPAQNSLLKVFEEPPSYCTIILITDNANGLLQTIRSRAMLVRFSPLSRKSVEEYLTERFGTDRQRAEVLAVISGGSIGRAVEILEDDGIIQMRDAVICHIMSCLKSEKRPLYDFIKYLKQNKASVKFITDMLASWFEDVLYIKSGCGDKITNADKEDELKKFCRSVTKKSVFGLCRIVSKYSSAIEKNANYSIAVQCMAMECWEEIHGRNYRSAI